MGRDFGVLIPESMLIEIVDAMQPGRASDLYERAVTTVNREMSKAVLGQTASTEGTPGKLGSEDAQQEVRLDIEEADASSLEGTVNRDYVKPFVMLNWGEQDAYPVVRLPVPRPEDTTALVDNIVSLMPYGFRVVRSEMYARLGLTEPGPNDEVLEAVEDTED